MSEQRYIIKGESPLGSEWLVGYPSADMEALNQELETMREKMPECTFTIINYTVRTLAEVYPRERRFVAQAHVKDNAVQQAAVDTLTYDETLYYFLQQTGRR